MRTVEAFLIGVVLGGLIVFGFVVSREPPSDDAVPPRVAARDTACACCTEYLDHIAAEHR